VVGVAWYEYIFAEQEDTLYIIDQHAAHERILYERFQQAMATEAVSQQLLVPQVVQLTHREHAALLGAIDDLREAGFDLEDFGDRSIRVRAVPLILDAPQVKACLGDLAESLMDYRALPSQEQRRDRLVKLACRKAVKAGDPLPQAAIEGLLDEMRRTGAPPTCPHGRPLVIRIDKTELDKRFRRIVS
jgi:DNA mismatch repair protein MutL